MAAKWLFKDGKLQFANNKIQFIPNGDTADDCSCCGTKTTCGSVDCNTLDTDPSDFGNIDPPLEYHPDEYYSDQLKVCHRLFTYSDCTHNGVTIDTFPSPVILKTNDKGAKSGPGRNPFTTSFGSGSDLDTEPNWWSLCEIGGWTTTTSWKSFSAAEMYACANSIFPAAGTNFDLLVHVEFSKKVRYERDATGGGYDWANPVRTQNESDGGLRILKIYVEY